MTRKLVGYCGVDSGQILLTDPCYVKDFISDEHFEPTKGSEHPYSYNGACGASLSEERGGQLLYPLGHVGGGVCVSTGIGDGIYPVYLDFDESGNIISATIQFMYDEEIQYDEDEDDSDYDEDEEQD